MIVSPHKSQSKNAMNIANWNIWKDIYMYTEKHIQYVRSEMSM
jgi:hypothetical protein